MKLKSIVLTGILIILGSTTAFSHCQVPCGIYGDDLRFAMMKEHVTTIEKAMKQIDTLSKGGEKNFNQIVRWVNTKEDHASQLGDIAVQYFLYQRIKVKEKGSPEYSSYQKSLELVHNILILSMKAKQKTDASIASDLITYIEQFEKHYNHKK